MYLVYNEQTGDFEEKLYKDPPELSFNMANSGNSVFKGDKVHLTWSTKDAEKVTLDGEELSDQVFSQDIICENTGLRDFVLVASNPCGETRRVISVPSLIRFMIQTLTVPPSSIKLSMPARMQKLLPAVFRERMQRVRQDLQMIRRVSARSISG